MCESSLSVVLPEGEDDGAAELPVRVPQQPLQFLLDGETHQVLPRQDTLHLTSSVRQILISDALKQLLPSSLKIIFSCKDTPQSMLYCSSACVCCVRV